MTAENLLEMIKGQIEILKGCDEAVAILTVCYEKLLDLEMELN